jgi:phage shock protein E
MFTTNPAYTDCIYDTILHSENYIYEVTQSTMTKKSRTINRPSTIIILAVLTIVLGTLAWVSVNQLNAPSAPVVRSQLISPLDYQARFGDGVAHALIDVRTPEEFSSGHIPNAINIHVDTLHGRLDEIPKDMPIVVYCRSGNRSATAARILINGGFEEVYDLGGIQEWVARGYPIQE